MSLYNLLAEIGSFIQDIIQLCIFILKKSSYSLANGKMICKFVKLMRRFCFNRCFKGCFSTWVKYEKYGIWRGLFCRLLNEGSTELIENGIQGGDSLEGSAHTPMYNPHILPLSKWFNYLVVAVAFDIKHFFKDLDDKYI